MIKYVDLGIFVKNTLIISDLHIGYEAYLNKKGVLVPRVHFEKQKKRLIKLFRDLKPKLVILNGDIKHEFGTINSQEWKDTYEIIEMIKRVADLIMIKGNHDKITEVIAKKKDVKVVDHYIIDDVYICHGDFIPRDIDKAKTIIIGHEHPAITLKDEAKSEKFKCFVKCKYKNKDLYVLPSFNLVNEGSDIQEHEFMSPFLKDVKKVKVTVSQDGELFDFGEIKLE